MKKWKKYILIMSFLWIAAAGILGFPGASRAAESSEFKISEETLYRYEGSGGAVVIPDGIMVIDNEAFKNCTEVTAIEIPTSVVWIERDAFSGCTGLTKMKIPGSVKVIEDGAFSGCTALAELTLEEGIEKIGETAVEYYGESKWSGAFSGCISLRTVVIPDSIQMLGVRTFKDCTSLEQITFSKGLSVLEQNICFGCTGLTKVRVPGNVKVIKDGAFSSCTALTELTLEEGIEEIGETAAEFYGASKWCGAFSGCSSLQTLDIPDSVRILGIKTFKDCTALEQVRLSKGQYSLYWETFDGCTSLKELKIPENIGRIYDYVFSGCSALEHISFPENPDFDQVKGSAFSGTKWLGNRRKENPLVIVGGILIDGAAAAGRIKVPETVTEIGEMAFYGDENLVEVEIPGNVKQIGRRAFAFCKNLERVKLCRGIESIVEYAFSECDKLAEIEIPEGVTSLGYGAFARCDSLKRAVLPGSIDSIRGTPHGYLNVFSDCQNLEFVSISEGMKEIDNRIFYNCTNLKRIEVPSSVKCIQDEAFKSCGSGFTFWGQASSYAHTYAEENGIPFRILGSDRGKVTFDKNGGKKLSFRRLDITEGEAYGKLPRVVRKGYLFEGWHTKKSGGSKVLENTRAAFPLPKTLYAHWKKIRMKRPTIASAVSPAAGRARIRWKKVAGADGYHLTYAADKNFQKAKNRTVTKKTLTMNKLRKGETYYVKVRAYRLDSAGERVYGKYSKMQKVKIKK